MRVLACPSRDHAEKESLLGAFQILNLCPLDFTASWKTASSSEYLDLDEEVLATILSAFAVAGIVASD